MKITKITKLFSQCSDYLKKLSISEKWIRRNQLYYQQATLFFSTIESKSLIEREASINQLLDTNLRIKTPHLKKFYTKSGGLHKLPFIDKNKVKKSLQDFVSPLGKLSITSGTSGSTGTPLVLYRSFPSIVLEQAAIDIVYKKNGIDPLKSKIAILRGDTIKEVDDFQGPYWEYQANGRILKLSSHHLNKETLDSYLDELSVFSADVIYAYPSAIEFLSYLITHSQRDFTVPIVITSSEVFNTESRVKVANILNCSICDYYGQAERIAFSYSQKENEYYFLVGYSLIELDYKHSDNEHDYYEIIGTSLWNKAMPLQRYRTGDLAILPKNLMQKDLNKIRYGLMPFKGVLGRTSEYLISPQGSHLIGINQIPKYVSNVVRMQFIQESLKKINIYVLPEKSYNTENEREIIKKAREKIPKSIDIKVVVTDQLQKTKNNKVPLIIRNI